MAQLGEVVFALERFELSAEERLEVVGRWEGLEGRRLGRPVLTVVETTGRRRRLTALPGGQLSSTAWRASFAWEGDVATIERAELELGRRLVVELPAPRRRRRRSGHTASTAAARAGAVTRAAAPVRVPEVEPVPARVDTSAAELEAARAELEALRAELDTLRPEVETLRAEAAANRMEMSSLEERLQRARDGIVERDQKLMTLQESTDVAVDQATAEAARRVDTARAEAAELRTKLAEAREQSEHARVEMTNAIAAEVEETERMRVQLREARDAAERTVAAEQAETARLREELAKRAPVGVVAAAASSSVDETTQEYTPSTRRMLDRVNRDLERERAQNRTLRRDLESVQGELAELRRSAAMIAAASAEQPASVLMRPGPAHRVDVARAAGAHLIPDHRPSPVRLWGARLAATLLVAVLLLALALIVVPLL